MSSAPRPMCRSAGAPSAPCSAIPYAGRYVADILPMMEQLKPVGLEMAQKLLASLGGKASAIEGYGKGAIVGTGGEIEHGALWHVPGGYAMRELLGGAKAIVPSTKKVGGPGTRLDVPVTHVNASYVRSHFDGDGSGRAGCARPRRAGAGAGDDDRVRASMPGLADSGRKISPGRMGSDESEVAQTHHHGR